MRSLSIAATGMLAQQLNVEVISNNIANMSTTGFQRRRAEFQRVYSQGIRVAGRHVVLFAVRTEGSSRFGVTASKKVGNAVVRARSKRRLRELYRHRRAHDVLRSVELVANARRSCARAPWPVLERDFDACLERLGERLRTARP